MIRMFSGLRSLHERMGAWVSAWPHGRIMYGVHERVRVQGST